MKARCNQVAAKIRYGKYRQRNA